MGLQSDNLPAKKDWTNRIFGEDEIEEVNGFIRPSDEKIQSKFPTKRYKEYVERVGWIPELFWFVNLPLIESENTRLVFSLSLQAIIANGTLLILHAKICHPSVVFCIFVPLSAFFYLLVAAHKVKENIEDRKADRIIKVDLFTAHVFLFSLLLPFFSNGLVIISFGRVDDMYRDMYFCVAVLSYFAQAICFFFTTFNTDIITKRNVKSALNWIEKEHILRINSQISDLQEIRESIVKVSPDETVEVTNLQFDARHRKVILSYLGEVVDADSKPSTFFDVASPSSSPDKITPEIPFHAKIDSKSERVALLTKDVLRPGGKEFFIVEVLDLDVTMSFFRELFRKDIFPREKLAVPKYEEIMSPEALDEDEKSILYDLLFGDKCN